MKIPDSLDATPHFYRTKLAHVVVLLGKREYPDVWADFFWDIYKSCTSGIGQKFMCVLIYKEFIEDAIDFNEDLPVKRRALVVKELRENSKRFLHAYIEVQLSFYSCNYWLLSLWIGFEGIQGSAGKCGGSAVASARHGSYASCFLLDITAVRK